MLASPSDSVCFFASFFTFLTVIAEGNSSIQEIRNVQLIHLSVEAERCLDSNGGGHEKVRLQNFRYNVKREHLYLLDGFGIGPIHCLEPALYLSPTSHISYGQAGWSCLVSRGIGYL